MFSSARWEYQSRDNGTSSITENPHRQHGPHPPDDLRHAHHADGYERDRNRDIRPDIHADIRRREDRAGA